MVLSTKYDTEILGFRSHLNIKQKVFYLGHQTDDHLNTGYKKVRFLEVSPIQMVAVLTIFNGHCVLKYVQFKSVVTHEGGY